MAKYVKDILDNAAAAVANALGWAFILLICLILFVSLGVSGCAGINPLAVNPKTTPEAQKIAAEAKAEFDRALAARLIYCDIRGRLGADAKAKVTDPGAGIDVDGSFTCLPRPWTALKDATDADLGR
jgi:hypothetical protein